MSKKNLLLKSLCFLYLLQGALFATNELGAIEEPLFISLGCNCGMTGVLRTNGLRLAAYPFDWILSIDVLKLIEIFEDNFLFFFDDQYLVPDKNGTLFHYYYHFEFSHEGSWINGGLTEERLNAFKSKYLRRIERFRHLNEYPGEVFFIRASYPDASIKNPWYEDPVNFEITDKIAHKLYLALKNLFPDLSFTLLLLNQPRFESDREIKMLNSNLYIFRSSADLFSLINKADLF